MLFKIIWVWWIKPIVPALERLRQVDYYEFETRQSNIQSSNAIWATVGDLALGRCAG